MPKPPPRTNGKKRRCILPVMIMQSLWEMDEFEKEGITKSSPVVKKKLNK